jgi:hypothetical protein
MSTVHELIVQGAAVLVTVAERDGLFYAKVNGQPEIQAVAETREAAMRKISNRVSHAADLAA